MDSGSQIDNVQSFVEIIGNNHNFWRLLSGREVIHFVRGRGRVSAIENTQIWINFPIVDIVPYEQTGYYTIKYQKEKFILGS